MRRLVIALTTILTLTGAAVVAGYLFVFGPGSDRAADLVPSTTLAYTTVDLSPSTGQEVNLTGLLTRLPGFSDQASLGEKIDELLQRFLAGTGLDYHADVKPWIGDQLTVVVVPVAGESVTNAASGTVVLASVRDSAAAAAAIEGLASRVGASLGSERYDDVEVRVLGGSSSIAISRVAIVDQMLIAASGEAAMRAVLDAATGHAGRLSDEAGFRDAMQSLPADRLASIYLNVAGIATLGGQAIDTSGYSTAGLALVATPDGLRLSGSAPFDQASAGASARTAFALGSAPSSLADWMPATTEAELVFFGAQQTFDSLTSELGSLPNGASVVQALTQLRALLTLGLNISLDKDLLPLFDREAAIGLQGLGTGTLRGQLLLRSSDPAAAANALSSMRAALQSRGASITTQTVSGATVTQVAIPGVGQLAYATRDGVIIVGLTPADVAAALSANASGETLGASSEYRAAFEVAGGRGGNELYVAGTRVADLVAAVLGEPVDALPSDLRDILSHVGALALSVPSGQSAIEIHATVTVH